MNLRMNFKIQLYAKVSGKSAHKKTALCPNVYTKPVSGFGIVGTQGGR